MSRKKIYGWSCFLGLLLLLGLIFTATLDTEDYWSESTFEESQAPARPAAPEASSPRAISAEEAFALMTGEAEKGNAQAMLALGRFYEQGQGVPRNFIRARQWYEKAAEADLPEGYYNLGVAYEIGLGTDGSLESARANFHKAAELGMAQAMYKLSTLYLLDQGGSAKDEAQALEWLEKAAAAGHSIAANSLGVIYLEGLLGQPANADQALNMFRRSADMGNLEAMKNMAVMFKDGLGPPVDLVNALKWYSIAQKGGYQSVDLEPTMDLIKTALGPDQIQQTEQAVAEWIEAYQKKNLGEAVE